jgi:hypothetical protein
MSLTSHLEEIHVVCEYPGVFPDELPRMPPDWDVEFVIELQLGTAPISKRPYCMPSKELVELEKSNSRIVQVLHSPKFFSLGLPCTLCPKERW